MKVFSEEKPVFWREAAAGHSSSAYFIGKTLASLPRFVLSSFHFTSIYVYFAVPVFPSFFMHYAIVFLTFFGVYGIAALVSCVTSAKNANLLSVIFCIFAAACNGFGPNLTDLQDWGIPWLFDFSFNRWATECLFSSSVTPLSNVYDIRGSAKIYGFVLFRENFDLGMMFLIGVVLRIAAYIALKLRDRDKQK